MNATATSISTPISSAGANYTYGITTNYTAVVSPHSGAPAFTGTVQFFDGGIAIGAPVVPNAVHRFGNERGHPAGGRHPHDHRAVRRGRQLSGVGFRPTLPEHRQGAFDASARRSSPPARPRRIARSHSPLPSRLSPAAECLPAPSRSPSMASPVPRQPSTRAEPPAVTATLSAGSHTLSATYSGDSNFLPSSSGTLAQSVSSSSNPPSNNDPNLTVYANPNVPTLGDTVTLTVNISSDGAVPYGTVQFYDGTTLLGNGAGGWRPRHANHSDNQPRQCRIAQHHGELFRRWHQQPVVQELRSPGEPDSPGVEPHIEPVGIGLRPGRHVHRQGSLPGASGSQPSVGPGTARRCEWCCGHRVHVQGDVGHECDHASTPDRIR